jgi:hypothetical protein
MTICNDELRGVRIGKKYKFRGKFRDDLAEIRRSKGGFSGARRPETRFGSLK